MAWVIGVSFLLTAIAIVTLAVGWRPKELTPPIWDLPRVATTFTGVAGSLAGFSVASAFFLANLTAVRGSESFGLVIAMFLIAFVILISAAMLFAAVPNLALPPESPDYPRLQAAGFVFGSVDFHLGLSLAWLALRPFLLALGLRSVADLFVWVMLVAVIGGGVR